MYCSVSETNYGVVVCPLFIDINLRVKGCIEMKLSDLLSFDNIAIQCHDNPDADSIASGFALYEFFKAANKKVTFFYGGKTAISKANLLEMIKLLRIPLLYIQYPNFVNGVLVLVDCQRGGVNVTETLTKEVAVLDHHVEDRAPPALHVIRPDLSSCSTLVWHLLKTLNFKFSNEVLTALHYGLYADSSGFAEIRHPLDRDLRDAGGLQPAVLKILQSTHLSLTDLQWVSGALQNVSSFDLQRFAIVSVRPCDPFMLGLISDLVIQVEGIDTVVAYTEMQGGFKFSVRTVTRENKAADIAAWLTEGPLGAFGSGGGQAEKAGGFINYRKYQEQSGTLPLKDYIPKRLQQYLTAYTLVDASNPMTLKRLPQLPDQSYQKRAAVMGYLSCGEFIRYPSRFTIRMLEGDVKVMLTPNSYLMIGVAGEVYPISQERFALSYEVADEPFQQQFEYPPTVINNESGERVELLALAHSCISKSWQIKACQLSIPIKFFPRWDPDHYVKGEKGDWLVMTKDDASDLCVISHSLFQKLYE